MNFKALSRKERIDALEQMGEKKFREKQIFQWICRGAQSFDEMTDLSAALRKKLSGTYEFTSLVPEVVQTAKDGTKKFLLDLEDGNKVEAVFMKYSYGNSLCISTQVGCNMGCRFCASTLKGKSRDLLPWEMLDEYIVCRREAGEDINHIVLMGIGEPFDNYENVSEFLDLIHSSDGIGLSLRNITVSTCGKVPEIIRFSKDYPQVNLAVSLHASNQDDRLQIMPIARAYDIDTLIDTCRKTSKDTGRRITFEYTLISGKNDSRESAEELAKLLSGMLCHVNLIPLNPVAETGFSSAARENIYEFQAVLESRGIPATVRRSLGSEIDAACGQLRNKN